MSGLKGYLNNKLFLAVLFFLISGCAAHNGTETVDNGPKVSGSSETATLNGDIDRTKKSAKTQVKQSEQFKPQVMWRPSYSMSPVNIKESDGKASVMKVGAEIKSLRGKVPLNTVVNGLAKLKNMNVSWSSDVDQGLMVSAHIKASTDFWEALGNVLRQADYFYEFKENTIIVKYLDTKKFYIANPFLIGSYETSVGGDFLGNNSASSIHGQLQVGHKGQYEETKTQGEPGNESVSKTSKDSATNFDIWGSIERNLTRILASSAFMTMDREDELAQEYSRMEQNAKQVASGGETDQQAEKDVGGDATDKEIAKLDEQISKRKGFYYTIDKPLGIVYVTAPRSVMERVEDYMETLNRELSRQVVIEAKLLEVQLTDDTTQGVDWSSLLKESQFNFEMALGSAASYIDPTGSTLWYSHTDAMLDTWGQLYPTEGVKLLRGINVQNKDVGLIVDFLSDFGDVKILSNPKISLLNGQPGLITGGKTQTIIDRVSSVVTTSGGDTTITYNVITRDILSGIGMSVVANINDQNDILLHLTPVSTELENPDNLEERSFGSESTGFLSVQLPRISLREMTTMAKVKSGQLLIIGGIITEQEGVEGNKVPLLGDIPYLGYAFKSERKFKISKELVILLRPQIVNL